MKTCRSLHSPKQSFAPVQVGGRGRLPLRRSGGLALRSGRPRLARRAGGARGARAARLGGAGGAGGGGPRGRGGRAGRAEAGRI